MEADATPRCAQESLRGVELDMARAEPVLFVCGHGGRDRCCVIEGRPLAAELAGSGVDVWECSHLGGHRFAPTALVLPSGYAYGRLDVSATLTAFDAARAGEMELGRCRGRTTWPGPGQVAELVVRATVGIWAVGALTVDVGDPKTPRVRHVDGRTWQVGLHRGALAGPRPSDCGGEPEPVSPLIAGPVEQVT
ncbi:sucrase ferredoxin [Pseudonocardia nantongensis]|uniref:sucrase ferredoxin n=1 Tax=Pseudonocardia nantongensis TaxID=1181885 RepID=UPI00397A9FD7